MPLVWIVPGRRAVVAGDSPLEYGAVMEEWETKLGELRSTLLDWYRPLATRPQDFDQNFDDAMEWHLRPWRERKFSGSPPPPRTVASATNSQRDNRVDVAVNRIGFEARLWKGPLRVLLEEAKEATEAEQAEDSEETEEADWEPAWRGEVQSIELSHQGAIKLDQLAGVVINHDARFLAGDILEFPIFKIFAMAGVRPFRQARFNPLGSPFLGTSVSPTGLRLHDNQLAMRFQLILNAKRGAFGSFQPTYGGDFARHENNHSQGGRTVHARGMMYAGSLGNPDRHGEFWFHCNQWGTGVNLPTAQSVSDLPNSMPLTPGWSCSPCALNLARYVMADATRWGGGSANRHARRAHDDDAIGSSTDYDYFGNVLIHPGGEDDVYPMQMARHGAPSGANYHWLRSNSLALALGNGSASDQSPEDPELSDEDDPREAVYDDDSEDEPIYQAPNSNRAPLSAAIPAGGHVVRSAAQMRGYFSEVLTSVALNGHEYSYVRLYPHDKLMEESASNEGAPCTSLISAYNPLSGEPYPSSGEGDFYLFEGAGYLYKTRLPSPHNYQVFRTRPAKWERVNEFYWRQSEAGRIYIGEALARDGRPNRNKYLLSISRFRADAVRQVHASPREFPRITYLRGRNADTATSRYYAERAVPFPTMSEAKSFGSAQEFQNLRDVAANQRTARERLRPLLDQPGRHLSVQGRRIVHISERRLRNMTQYAENVRRRELRRIERVERTAIRDMERAGRPTDPASLRRAEVEGRRATRALNQERRGYVQNIARARRDRQEWVSEAQETTGRTRRNAWDKAAACTRAFREARQQIRGVDQRLNAARRDPAVRYAEAQEQRRELAQNSTSTPEERARHILEDEIAERLRVVLVQLGAQNVVPVE